MSFGHPFIPRCVHAVEIIDVGNKNLTRQDARFITTRLCQQTINMAQHFACLALNIVRRVFCNLSCQVYRAIVNGDFRLSIAYMHASYIHVVPSLKSIFDTGCLTTCVQKASIQKKFLAITI